MALGNYFHQKAKLSRYAMNLQPVLQSIDIKRLRAKLKCEQTLELYLRNSSTSSCYYQEDCILKYLQTNRYFHCVERRAIP